MSFFIELPFFGLGLFDVNFCKSGRVRFGIWTPAKEGDGKGRGERFRDNKQNSSELYG